MGIRIRLVEPSEYGEPIGRLAGIKDFKIPEGEQKEILPSSWDFPEQMLIFCGFSGGRMNELLNQMKKAALRIDLKAMLTPTNQYWNSQELYEELKREHEAMRQFSESQKKGEKE